MVRKYKTTVLPLVFFSYIENICKIFPTIRKIKIKNSAYPSKSNIESYYQKFNVQKFQKSDFSW